MAQATSISLNDGTATPVAVSYTPFRLADGTIVYSDNRLGVMSIRPTLSFRMDRANAKRPTDRIYHKIAYPTSKVVDGVTVVNSVLRADKTFVVPIDADAQTKKHFAALSANSEDHAHLRAAIETGEGIW